MKTRPITYAACVFLLSGVRLSATTFFYSDAEAQFDVITTGFYAIAGYGASGGAGYDFVGNTYTGGLGAGISGNFLLTSGQVIDVYVGQQGGNGWSGPR